MKMITCVAWKANKVLDGSRLLVLIKNHRQLNCSAVVLCWPVIASETENEIVRGTAADIVSEFLPHAPPSSLDFAKLSSVSFLSQCNEVSSEEDSLNCTLIGGNYRDKMSLELILYAPESQVRHLRSFCSLRLFCHICISWSKPLLKCTLAELCISELIMLICNSLRALNNM